MQVQPTSRMTLAPFASLAVQRHVLKKRAVSTRHARGGAARLVDVEVAVLRRVVAHVGVRAALEDVVLGAVDLLLAHQVGDVDDADAVVRVERRDLVARALHEPRLQVVRVAVVQRLREGQRFCEAVATTVELRRGDFALGGEPILARHVQAAHTHVTARHVPDSYPNNASGISELSRLATGLCKDAQSQRRVASAQRTCSVSMGSAKSYTQKPCSDRRFCIV